MARSAPFGTLWEGARSVMIKSPKEDFGGMGQRCDLSDLWLLVSRTQGRIKKFPHVRFVFQGLIFQNLESDFRILQYFFDTNVFQNLYIAPNGHFG